MNGIDHDRAAARLATDHERQLARFAQAARHLRRRSDPAAAHDARVALRQLEATLDLWRAFLPRRPRRRAARAMRRLRRALGPVGEARMIASQLELRLSSLPPTDRVVALELARYARRRFAKVAARSGALCAKRRVRRLRRLYEGVWRAREGRWAPGASWLQCARDRVHLRRARAGEALCTALALQTDETLHAARLAVKRWRYASERLGAVVPAGDASTREWLKSVQDTLGRIADLHALRANALRWAEKHVASDGALAKPAPTAGLLERLEAERAGCIEEFRRLLSARPLTPVPAPAPPSPAAGTSLDS